MCNDCYSVVSISLRWVYLFSSQLMFSFSYNLFSTLFLVICSFFSVSYFSVGFEPTSIFMIWILDFRKCLGAFSTPLKIIANLCHKSCKSSEIHKTNYHYNHTSEDFNNWWSEKWIQRILIYYYIYLFTYLLNLCVCVLTCHSKSLVTRRQVVRVVSLLLPSGARVWTYAVRHSDMCLFRH